ncbi:chain-length determining protein [Phormidesmis priestleyi ULC007]|uniref:non-specific protein-tyrosine kinase n=1 Tax=Phormidesmis priestleyi ULC007 TaxID=1920490 RepID=A0A2T1D539_9CYAN|nr:chain-length determining protein [Phormidesmis priestleyi ULC007]
MAKAPFSLSPLPTLKRHSFVALSTFVSVAVGATALSFAILPRQYETSAKLIVGEKDVGISTLGQALTEINTQAPGKAADPVATQAELMQSQQVLESALSAFQQESKIPKEQLPDIVSLRQALKVDIVPGTNILQVSYTAPDPKIAAGLLNEITASMVAENSRQIRSQAATLRAFLERRLPQQEAKLRESEAAESQYRQTYGIVSFDTQAQSMVNSLAALEDEARKLSAQLQEDTTKVGLLQKVTGANNLPTAYASVRLGQNETLKELQKQLTNLDVAIVDTRSRLGDQHPDLLALLQKRDELRALYGQQISQATPGGTAASYGNAASNPLSQDLMSRYIASEVDRAALVNRLRVVQSELNPLRSRINQLPGYQRPLIELARQQQNAQDALKLMSGKLEEARIAEGQLLSNVRVVEQASVPVDPSSPKTLPILAISIVSGLIMAGGVVLLLELMVSTIRNPAEAEAVLGLAVLGVLPKLTPPTNNLVDLERFLDNSNQVEPYRKFLKVLESSSEQKPQVFVFSSATVGDGKSAVVLHLAAVAAMLSRRTLIIDADLRHPLQHRLLNLAASPGLAEVINDNLSFLEAVQATSVPNLSVLPCGQSLQRPSALIETAAMARLLEKAANHYDCVIVDTSPLSICADAETLSQAANGLVLVVQPNSSKRDLALQTISDLRKAGVSLLGLVMNETVLPDRNELSGHSSASGYVQSPLPLRSISSSTQRGG